MSATRLPARTDSPFATIGLDLTGLGVDTDPARHCADLPVDKADLARLASYTRSAHTAGADFVSLGAGFRLRTDHAVRRESWLDPLVAARRIGPHAGAAGIVASVDGDGADLGLVAGELSQVIGTAGTWTGLEVTSADGVRESTLDGVARAFARLRTTGRAPRTLPRVVLPVAAEREVELAGTYADVVRVRETDLGWARELRYAVRAAARSAGRDVRVLVDLHTVVAPDRAAAQERAGLVADIAGERAPWAGALAAVGTVQDVADVVERWITAGAADGFTVLPGSLPADVVALLRGVLPELRSRGLVPEREVAARPAVRRPGTAASPAAAGAVAGRTAVAAVHGLPGGSGLPSVSGLPGGPGARRPLVAVGA